MNNAIDMQLAIHHMTVFVPYVIHQHHVNNVTMKQSMSAVVSKPADMESMKSPRIAMSTLISIVLASDL